MSKKSELEELVEFLHHGNTPIRQTAVVHLTDYSLSHPEIFKHNDLEPLRDLKMLVNDYPPIAASIFTILINITSKPDPVIEKALCEDDAFLEVLLNKVTSPSEPNADSAAMLLANMVKAPAMRRIVKMERDKERARPPPKELSTSTRALDQLLDCFVKGAAGSYNPKANYDYLAYLFSDLSKYPEGQAYFTTPQSADSDIVPMTKLVVFTEHPSAIRRRGVASTIKNVAFSVSYHQELMAPVGPKSDDELDHIHGINILPYLLLPLMGPEEYDEDDTDGMLDDVQLLPDDKKREPEPDIIAIHLDTLLLLTTSKAGRTTLRRIKTYPIIRECHKRVEDEDVLAGCDRLVQILMREDKDVPDIQTEDVLARPGEEANELESEDEDMEVL